MYGAEQNRKPIARRRHWWKKYQARIEPCRLVLIDEAWTKTDMPLTRMGRHGAITAPCVFDGLINGERFLRYVEQFVVLTLKPFSSHKGQAVRTVIRAAGARPAFLTAYSPGLNPIEQVFAKLKLLHQCWVRIIPF